MNNRACGNVSIILYIIRMSTRNLDTNNYVSFSMNKNPFINALVAAGYISLLVTFIFNSPKFITDNELGMMAPILFLSLFVISAALMGYLFVYQPACLLIDGKHAEATKLFLSTLASFAGITVAVPLAWFLLSSVF